MTNRFIAPKLLAIDPALIESPPGGEIQGLVERAMALANGTPTEIKTGGAHVIRELCEAITRFAMIKRAGD